MKKYCMIAFVIISCSLVCNSQNYTQYLGNVRTYVDLKYGGVYYARNVYASETVYGESVSADEILFVNEEGVYSYSSSFGRYKEFLYEHYVTGGYTVSKGMKFYTKDYGTCAFAYGYGKLFLVTIDGDRIINVLDDDFNAASDFSIVVRDNSALYNSDKTYEPSIYIINNGYVKYYNDISSFITSIYLAKKSVSEGGKQFSLEGIEVNEQHKGVIIDNGKKIINK